MFLNFMIKSSFLLNVRRLSKTIQTWIGLGAEIWRRRHRVTMVVIRPRLVRLFPWYLQTIFNVSNFFILLLYYKSFLTYLICSTSTILGINGLKSADVPLSNKQTNKQTNKNFTKNIKASAYKFYYTLV